MRIGEDTCMSADAQKVIKKKKKEEKPQIWELELQTVALSAGCPLDAGD